MSVEPTDYVGSRANETLRAVALAVGALVLLLLVCWIVVSLGAWRLAETWKPGD